MLLLLIAGFTEKVHSEDAFAIGNATYGTLTAAYNAVQKGETIRVIANVELNESINVVNKIFILDLNGKKITSAYSADVKRTFLQIGSGSDITIIDSSTNQDGVITCTNDGGNMVPIVLVGTGRLTINAGNIVSPDNLSNNSYFCAVSVNEESATLIINGGTFSTIRGGNSPVSVISNKGTITINGGTIKNIYASGGNSARTINNTGTLIVNGGEIISASQDAIWTAKNKNLLLSSAAKITGNVTGASSAVIDYIIADGSDLNTNVSVTANTITYDRGSSNTFGTVCLPFVPDSKSTITYYTLKDATDNTLTLEQVNEFVANTPYVYFTEDGTYNVSKASTTTLAANPVAGIVSNDNGWSLKGVYKRTSVFASANDADYDDTDASHVVEPNSYYIKNNGFSKTDGYVVVKPFRAYITAPDGAANSNHYEISVIDEATAMKSLLEEKQTISAIYDVNGVRLSRLQRGVNIVVMGNGKRAKIIVK